MANFLSPLTKLLPRRWLYSALSLTVALGICVGTPYAGQAASLFDLIFRGIQVIQLSNISDRQEVQIGRQINQQLVSREVRLYRDSAINDYVNQVGQRIASTSSRPNLPYTFQVVRDDSVNAFATMGGFVYVNTGLLKAAENEAQLASVLAHETGHIAGRHAIQQMRQAVIAQGLTEAAGIDSSIAVQIGVDLAVRRPNSRKDELEADNLGITNLRRAGYAPEAAIAFMEKLQGGGGPALLRTHPHPQDRVSAMRRQIGQSETFDGSEEASSGVSDSSAVATGDRGLDNAAYRAKIQRLL